MPIPNQKTVVVQLLRNVALASDGTTTFSYLDPEIPELEEWGPYIERITILTVTTNRQTNHAWGVFASWSLLGREWSDPENLHTVITADGETVQAGYTTRVEFAGRRLKLLAGVRNVTGSAQQSALVSAWAVIDFQT